jgi:hypothetical protein
MHPNYLASEAEAYTKKILDILAEEAKVPTNIVTPKPDVTEISDPFPMPSKYQKWEYISIPDTEDENDLNDRGQEGWELVSVANVDPGRLCYFKRPVK